MVKLQLINLIGVLIFGSILAGCVDDRRRKVFPVEGFAVAGVVQYEKSTPKVTNFRTIRKASETGAVSCAKIEVIDPTSGEVIADGETRADGSFIIGLPDDREGLPHVVRVLTVSALDKFPMMVVNQDRRVYMFDSEPFTATINNMLLTISDSNGIEGAYNVFAQVMKSYKFMIDFGGEATTDFSELEVRWENGDVGVDCTCFFQQFLQPAVINLREDEDDDAVIIHEFGHYIQNTLANDSSPGGLHIISCGQMDDPRLTYSEGWATGFSCIVRRNKYYIDTDNQNFFVDHEDPCHQGQGPVSETLVAAVFFDLFDGNNILQSEDPDTINISFLKIWNSVKAVPSSSSITMHDFYLALMASGDVTPQQWSANFDSLGFDITTLQNNSSPGFIGAPAPHAPPAADPEFQSILEQQ